MVTSRMFGNFLEVLDFSNSTGSSITTLFSLISVGYHLELHVAITFYQEYQFLPK